MTPFALLIGKGVALLAVLALIAGGVHWCVKTIDKANERDAAVARADQVEREKSELARTFAAAQADDRAVADELRAFRAEESDRATEFRAKLAARPLTREVRREALPDGTCPPVRVRDPVAYGELFNEAVGPEYPARP